MDPQTYDSVKVGIEAGILGSQVSRLDLLIPILDVETTRPDFQSPYAKLGLGVWGEGQV